MPDYTVGAGSIIDGKYELVERLSPVGTGQGAVWKACRLRDRLYVAVKLFWADNPSAAIRAVDAEARALRQIEPNRHVAGFIDSGVSDGHPYVVTQLIAGRDLQAVVSAQGRLSDRQLRSAAVGSLFALHACHRANIVHRDVKPSNLVINEATGDVVLVDFGISVSLLASTIEAQGRTPHFMSPEFDQPKPPPASDIFSWGATMVYLATGRFAFGNGLAPNAAAVKILAIFKDRSPRPRLDGLPDWLLRMCARALAWSPADRPSAAELLDLMAGDIDDTFLRPPARPTTPTEVQPPSPRRRVRPPISASLRPALDHPYGLLAVAVATLVAWRVLPGPAAWRTLAAAAVAAGGLLLLVQPPSANAPPRRAWRRYSRRWTRWTGPGRRAIVLPATEAAILGGVLGAALSWTVVRPAPDTPAAARGLLVALVALGVLAAAVGPRRWVVRPDPASTAGALVVPVTAAVVPVALLQVRSVGATHVAIVGRAVPWWVVMAVAVGLALWATAGTVAVCSRLAYQVTLAVAAAAGAVVVVWAMRFHPIPGTTVWSLATTEVRVGFVLCVAAATVPLAAVTASGPLRRLAMSVALVGGAAGLLMATWWIGWTTWPDAWIHFHLPSGFVPWWRDPRHPTPGG